MPLLVETFKDIRLVGAPPQSIGKFGSDTDRLGLAKTHWRFFYL